MFSALKHESGEEEEGEEDDTEAAMQYAKPVARIDPEPGNSIRYFARTLLLVDRLINRKMIYFLIEWNPTYVVQELSTRTVRWWPPD